MFESLRRNRLPRLIAAGALLVSTVGAALLPVSASAAALPDLMLGLSAPATVVHNTTFSYSLKLHNDGPVVAEKLSVMGTLHRDFQIRKVTTNDPSWECRFKNDDFIFGEIWVCASKQPLASQGTVIVTIVARTPAVPGNSTLQHLADPNNLVPESDEGNNSLNQAIQVN